MCDETQAHLHQQNDEHHSHQHCHAQTYGDQALPPQQQPTPHRHQKQRKHSHNALPSRHTSPHSHHSHSLNSSPHQSHRHVHDQEHEPDSLNRTHPRPTTQSSSSHTHHYHHRRRKRQHNYYHHTMQASSGGGSGSGGGNIHHDQQHNNHGCSRRHRSATDISSTSINTCHDPSCTDREIQEILVRKSCCSSSRTELAQYFAEDLYGSSRRPSSCCTSSDYCYQTDSTSLYGSRSSLSRNNSIKSASEAMRRKRLHQRQPSYTSISLRGLNASRPNSEIGSLTSIFDRAKQLSASDGGKIVVSPSKVTIERQTSKDALSQDLPEYACSPSPIRWSFLTDGKSPTELEAPNTKDAWKIDDLVSTLKQEREREKIPQQQSQHRSWKSSNDERPSTSAAARKRRESPFSCDLEESTTVLFHQEGEAYNNCCSNYIQCNTYLDQDLQITSEDIQQYLSKGTQQVGDVLNNSKNYPFQPSNALEFQYKNNFANNNITDIVEDSEGSRNIEGRFRRTSSKETNLNQNPVGDGCTNICVAPSHHSGSALAPTNINLSTSTNNINIVFNSCLERNASEVKFINTAHENVVSAEAHHSGYLPYTPPTYDYTNMSANSLYDKPLGIDELSKEFGNTYAWVATTAVHRTSVLQSPIQAGISFESFDAASGHNLLSNFGSCQFLASPRSPLSPTSLGSPASSCLSFSINPAASSYPLRQYDIQHDSDHAYRHSSPTAPQRNSRTQHYHHRHHYHHNLADSFKFSNAFKNVRKRARKCTAFLRKK